MTTDAPPPEFMPSEAMARAKAEFYRWLDNSGGLRGAESVGLDELAKICHTTKIKEWLTKPAFQRWFYNRDYFATTVEALRDLAVEELKGIALDRTGLIEPKDKLRALNMLLQLADAFPKSGPQVVLTPGVPPEIQALPDAEVERMLHEGKKRLAAAKAADTDDEGSDG